MRPFVFRHLRKGIGRRKKWAIEDLQRMMKRDAARGELSEEQKEGYLKIIGILAKELEDSE